jgi:hypothetical protein
MCSTTLTASPDFQLATILHPDQSRNAIANERFRIREILNCGFQKFYAVEEMT